MCVVRNKGDCCMNNSGSSQNYRLPGKNDSMWVKNKQQNGSINWSHFWKEKSFWYTDVYTEQNHKKKVTIFLKRDYLSLCTQLLSTHYVLASVLCVGDTVINYPYKVTALMKYTQFRSDYNKRSQWDDRRSKEPTQLQVPQGPLGKGHVH